MHAQSVTNMSQYRRRPAIRTVTLPARERAYYRPNYTESTYVSTLLTDSDQQAMAVYNKLKDSPCPLGAKVVCMVSMFGMK